MKGVVNKKILIIICVAVIIIVAILISFLPSRNPQSTKPSQTNTIVNPNSASTNTHITYNNDSYTLSYPNTWNKTEKELSNNEGNVVIFQPQAANLEQYTTISVEVLNTQTTSIDTLTHLFTILHYTETNSIVAGVAALKYTAVLPTQNGDLHSMAYIFQRNGKIYTVKLEYIQQNTNEQLEGQFYQLVSSFSPH